MDKLIIPIKEIPYKEEKSMLRAYLKGHGLNLSKAVRAKGYNTYIINFVEENNKGKEINGTLQILIQRANAPEKEIETFLRVLISTYHEYPEGLDRDRPVNDLNSESAFLKFTLTDDDPVATLIGEHIMLSRDDIDLGTVLHLIITAELGLESEQLGDIFQAIYKGRNVNKFEKYGEE